MSINPIVIKVCETAWWPPNGRPKAQINFLITSATTFRGIFLNGVIISQFTPISEPII